MKPTAYLHLAPNPRSVGIVFGFQNVPKEMFKKIKPGNGLPLKCFGATIRFRYREYDGIYFGDFGFFNIEEAEPFLKLINWDNLSFCDEDKDIKVLEPWW